MTFDDIADTTSTPRAGRARAHSQIMVARRYVERGFLDAALRIFERNVAEVEADDWQRLADRLLERGRVLDAVRACQHGDLPLPRRHLMELGDGCLRRKDVHGAIRHYELAEADPERWSAVVDTLVRAPGGELHALEVTQRHLMGRGTPAS
jgi:hypothetical protein